MQTTTAIRSPCSSVLLLLSTNDLRFILCRILGERCLGLSPHRGIPKPATPDITLKLPDISKPVVCHPVNNTVCFAYPLPSQQFQQRIECLVLGSVEETLRVLLEFLALAKAQGHLVLLALEVRWWAQADLGWQPQPPRSLLKTLLVGAELRIPCLAQPAAYALQLLWTGKLSRCKQGWHSERLQQGSRGAGVALAYLVDIRDKFSRPIAANFETSEDLQQRLTVLCGIRANPQDRL